MSGRWGAGRDPSEEYDVSITDSQALAWLFTEWSMGELIPGGDIIGSPGRTIVMLTKSLPRAKAGVSIDGSAACGTKEAVDADPGLRSGQALRRHDGNVATDGSISLAPEIMLDGPGSLADAGAWLYVASGVVRVALACDVECRGRRAGRWSTAAV